MEEGDIFIPQIALGLRRTRLFTEVQERSRVDGLTGLYLRRYFLERFQTEIQRAKRYSGIFSLLMLDIDFFKKINDTYGHIVGDKVLCGISRIFVDNVRPGDLVGRYGGEEFIILIPMSRHEEVTGIAKEINRLVSQKEFSAENEKFGVTISIGISHYPHDGTSLDDILAGADHALYWVKSHGRNGVQEYWKIKQKSK
jgi:diguanylate cyclase (GGDEF)-like protein